MLEQIIHPVILCGGTGTRLWPVSRKSFPKQFTRLKGERTMLQETVQRLEDAGCGAPLFLTNEAYRFIIGAQADELGLRDHRIVVEPEPRNTAPAICAAAELLARTDPDALMLVAPSDHAVADPLALADAIARGAEQARDGGIVTFGVHPDRAETGYGYIEIAAGDREPTAEQRFRRFLEKPDPEAAQAMLEAGNYLWNAGMFLLKASTALEAFETHAPELRAQVRDAVGTAEQDLDFLRLGTAFAGAPAIAFDHAIMEKTDGWVVPMDPGWNDLGSWRSVWGSSDRNANGVATLGQAHEFDCTDTILMSTDPSVEVVGLGLRNIAAVATRDAVLVADLDNAQAVSQVVSRLREKRISQADDFTRCERPWGHYASLATGNRFQVKSIVVKPGGKLSLQSHVHRAEHWIVVEGTATVTIGSERKLVSENQSVFIPLGETHRLENHGKVPLQLIEVQTGAYLGEDDIIRYEDVYARV